MGALSFRERSAAKRPAPPSDRLAASAVFIITSERRASRRYSTRTPDSKLRNRGRVSAGRPCALRPPISRPYGAGDGGAMGGDGGAYRGRFFHGRPRLERQAQKAAQIVLGCGHVFTRERKGKAGLLLARRPLKKFLPFPASFQRGRGQGRGKAESNRLRHLGPRSFYRRRRKTYPCKAGGMGKSVVN